MESSSKERTKSKIDRREETKEAKIIGKGEEKAKSGYFQKFSKSSKPRKVTDATNVIFKEQKINRMSGEGTTRDDPMKPTESNKSTKSEHSMPLKVSEQRRIQIDLDSASLEENSRVDSYNKYKDVKQKVLDIIGIPKARSQIPSRQKNRAKRESKDHEKTRYYKSRRNKRKRDPPKKSREYEHSKRSRRHDSSVVYEVIENSEISTRTGFNQ